MSAVATFHWSQEAVRVSVSDVRQLHFSNMASLKYLSVNHWDWCSIEGADRLLTEDHVLYERAPAARRALAPTLYTPAFSRMSGGLIGPAYRLGCSVQVFGCPKERVCRG